MNGSRISPANDDGLRAALLDHYDRTARALPWRRDTDPYRVLVSEIMLQQTRVETVKEYYERWLVRFPTLADLATADEEEVLKAWEGLGYYRRARNLHRAAMVVREEHDGCLPSDSAGLRGLPGVGEYTAGAVSSIAFGERVPAVDGNVRRVLARLLDVPEPKPSWLRERAAELVPSRRPGDWNQALMELGATVCTPRSPKCGSCPLSAWCRARAAGTEAERPARPAKRTVPVRRIVLAVMHREGKVLIAKRPQSGLLAGMWAFPEAALDGRPDDAATRTVAREIAAGFGFEVGGSEELPPYRHRFTHLEALYIPWSMDVVGPPAPLGAGFSWLDPGGRQDRALPVAQRRVLESWVDRVPVGGA